jgi:hypothetical protein
MISLKSLLENVKTVPNVLFVSDRALDRRRSFARKLFSNRKCTGEIRTADKGSSAELRDLVNLYGSSYYDLVVVMCRGIYEDSEKSDIDLIKANYDIIISYCHGLKVPVCFSTFPSLQFVDDKFKDKIHFTLADDKKLDRWIYDHADYVLDTGIFDDDVFFEENGVFLNRVAHNQLYGEMLSILNQLKLKTTDVDTDDETEEEEEETDDNVLKFRDRGYQVDELQTLLTALEYDIKFSELMSKQFGRSTEAAVNKFKKEHGLETNGLVDEETIEMIQDAVDDAERSKNKVPEKTINLYGFPTGPVDSGKAMLGGEDGDWGGSLQKALEIGKLANDFVGKNIVTSQKRSRIKTASGNVSDHWVENLNTYAVDLATGPKSPENLENGDKLLAHIMDFLDRPDYVGGSWLDLNKDGYRYQIGWKVADHFDHIHVGVKKL